jgi:hypothetical protein
MVLLRAAIVTAESTKPVRSRSLAPADYANIRLKTAIR